MKKRLAVIALTAAMAAGLAGCGSSGSGQTSGAKNSSSAASASAEKAKSSSGKTYTVGIVQSMEHKALDSATKGFEKALKDKLGDNVKFDLQNAQGEASNNSTICNGFVSEGVDLIMANATPALQAATQATSDIPILGTSVTDYATALGKKDFNGTTGTNVSGTSDLAPIAEQEAMLKELLPKAKNVGILYCSAEPNSIYQCKEFEKALKKDGISYKTYTAADSNEVQSVTTKACEENDALYIPTDNTIAASIETVKNVVVPAKKPTIVGWEDGLVAGIASEAIDYEQLGYQTGLQAYDILVNGKDPGKMKVETAKKTTKLYNADLCKQMGIKVPDGYKAADVK